MHFETKFVFIPVIKHFLACYQLKMVIDALIYPSVLSELYVYL